MQLICLVCVCVCTWIVILLDGRINEIVGSGSTMQKRSSRRPIYEENLDTLIPVHVCLPDLSAVAHKCIVVAGEHKNDGSEMLLHRLFFFFRQDNRTDAAALNLTWFSQSRMDA